MNFRARLHSSAKLALLCAVSFLALSHAQRALAEPYLAIQNGYKCVQCHVNPTGGGLRSTFGDVFAENVMAMNNLPAGAPVWLGQAVQDIIRVGGNLRADYSVVTTPGAPSITEFDLQQFRLYADVTLIPNLLGIYVDEQVTPGAQTMEAYARIGSTSDWYIKAGRFYLPFGWRLQDQTAFVRTASLISMALPDNGVEFGIEHGNLSAQIDLTNGVVNNGTGYQVTSNVVWVESAWRVGASGSFTEARSANQFGNPPGNRWQEGLYAGVRTGPVAWLTEIDLIRQAGNAAPGPGTQTQIPAFVEANWLIHKGNNLKLTFEYYDPEKQVSNNGQTRWSVVYELTPIPFFQVRAGFRRNEGIPQAPTQNQTLAFVEAHAFL
ncbi:MAG TPA: hypothetical protein VNZ06_13225 [Steroidobacteraceae bacterium]|nr:hypothetical protein [Steroidobacteraceae bacterium]